MIRTLIAAALLVTTYSASLRAGGDEIEQTRNEDALLDAMIGQMLMVGFLGSSERDPGVVAVRDQLSKGIVGGVVLYPDNIGTTDALRALTAFLRNAKSSPRPFIAVDQEGGHVQRLTRRNGSRYFPSALSVGRNPSYASLDNAVKLYSTMAEQLAHAGFNLNFGPVVDLNLNPSNPVIGQRQRSYGADPAVVAMLARAFITAHREANIVTVAKHFPGHGSSRVDSHKSLADISGSWEESELEPYRILAKDGMLDAVMIGHLYHPRFSDGAKLPASLSGRAVKALRAKGYIGFDGVVVSDDLEMGAVSDYSLEERVVKAINAGTDLLVFSNVHLRDTELGPKLHAIIAEAVRDGRISRMRIEKAYGKIMLLKRRLAQKDLSGKW
ncbi:MAG TPA: glycoside hydrolase family 3 N-terminal domain-containing protein [Methyloceanibacter sp.]|nr:glycoside hydrolase family 3 N-terminal domain-containing protein [Methyloceanibacter sp.]